MKTSENPWLGLLSYQDPYKIEGKEYVFCGRDSAVSSIFSMIDNSALVTIYGKTGIGKTSVLNAGVCPILRSQGYLPVLVRLGTDSFAQTIVSRIEQEILQEGGKIESLHYGVNDVNTQSIDYLWKYLCTTTFVSAEGKQVFPVVILDQFEEIFGGSSEKSTLLLRQINALIDDNKEVPEEEGYSNITNYRFVIAIREDDLFYLEDAIDANYLSGMKQNRYRLAPLRDSEARDIIALGKKYIDHNDFDEIANKIIKQAKDENGQISTNILSLICSQVFLQSDGKITTETLNKIAQNPLESFYNDCVKHISEKTKLFIEDNLVDNDRRRFVKKKVFCDENVIPLNDQQVLTQGQYRIVQDVTAGNIKCVELIHDSIARTIFLHKITEQEKKETLAKKKRGRWLKVGGLLVVLFSLIGVAYALLKAEKYKNEKGVGPAQAISFAFSEEIGDDQLDEYWRVQLIVKAEKNKKDTVLMDTTVNDKVKDSLLFCVVPDSVSNIHILLKHEKSNVFEDYDTTMTISDVRSKPYVSLPIRRRKQSYVQYKGNVVTKDLGTEIGLPNAFVVVRNTVTRTQDDGAFSLYLKDSLTSEDVIYVMKVGFGVLEESNIISEGENLERFELGIDSNFYVSEGYKEFENKCVIIDSLLKDGSNWNYGYNRYKKYGGYKLKYNDESIDRIVILAQRDGGNLKGVFWFKDAHAKLRLPHFAYYLFDGTVNVDSLNKGEEAEFEICGKDVFNNEKKIRGTILHGTLSGEIKNGKGGCF